MASHHSQKNRWFQNFHQMPIEWKIYFVLNRTKHDIFGRYIIYIHCTNKKQMFNCSFAYRFFPGRWFNYSFLSLSIYFALFHMEIFTDLWVSSCSNFTSHYQRTLHLFSIKQFLDNERRVASLTWFQQMCCFYANRKLKHHHLIYGKWWYIKQTINIFLPFEFLIHL